MTIDSYPPAISAGIYANGKRKAPVSDNLQPSIIAAHNDAGNKVDVAAHLFLQRKVFLGASAMCAILDLSA